MTATGQPPRIPVWLFVLASACLSLHGQDAPYQTLEVYLHSRKVLPAAGITNILTLDESICHAEVSGDQLQFFGIARGETVAYAWMGDRRVPILIDVVERPEKPLPPSLLNGNGKPSPGVGSIGTSVQAAIAPNGEANYFLLHQFQWLEQENGDRLSIRGQAQDSTLSGAPPFNANSASITYDTPHAGMAMGDFPLEVNGGLQAKASPFSPYNSYLIRGAEFTLRRDDDQYQIFGGTTIPSYYLRFAGTRDVGGFNFTRKRNGKFFLYATTGWVGAPASNNPGAPRTNSLFQTAGFSWRRDSHWAFQATGGASTRGLLAQGAASYSSEPLTAYFTGTISASSFPLNQLQLFFAGGSSLTAGVTRKLTSNIRASVFYQHAETKPTALLPIQSSSDYANPNVSVNFYRRHSLTLNYTWNRYTSNLVQSGVSRNQRLDIALNSRLGEHITNTAQFTAGALRDPLQTNSEGQLMFQDSLNVPIKGQTLTFAFQQARYSPSLVNSLTSYASLLPTALQQLFELNPLGFVQSSDLPPDLRTLLDNLRPTDTQASVSAQFAVGRRLNFTPNVTYLQDVPGVVRGPHSESFGYSLSYRVTRSTQLTSSLSNTLLFNPTTLQLQRTTLITLGINKTFTGDSRSPIPFHGTRQPKGTIRGIVFRDMNLNSTYNEGEPGISGVRVELDSGQSAITDAQGRFEFTGLSAAAFRVKLPLDQFHGAIRLTSPAEVMAPLFDQKTAEVAFGVVNFARLIGNVFNDYTLAGKREPDSEGLRGIHLTLSGNGPARPIVTDGSGDFGLYDIQPGDYQLSLDPTSLPSNYTGSAEPAAIHIAPVTTVVADVPVRAIRSITGHVYFRAKPVDPLQPLEGIQLAIARSTATTSADGSFVLRDLPAGEWVLSVVPQRPLPPGLAAPKGKLKLQHEPIEVANTTIVISNPALLEYIQPRAAAPAAKPN